MYVGQSHFHEHFAFPVSARGLQTQWYDTKFSGIKIPEFHEVLNLANDNCRFLRAHREAQANLNRPIEDVLRQVEDEIFLLGKIG